MRPAQKAPENDSDMPGVYGESQGFNEAGAKSAGKPDHLCEEGSQSLPASMRPAQKAPENDSDMPGVYGESQGFNEAGAKSAGKQARGGKEDQQDRSASMRPAQKAPENLENRFREIKQVGLLQ